MWQDTWESDSRRPRHPRALDDEELFVVEGSQKITWRNVPTAENSAKYKGLIDIMHKNPSETATEASTVHTSPVCKPTWRQSSGTQREVQFHQQNHKNACHCHSRRRARHFLFGRVCKEKPRIDLRIQSSTFTQKI